MKRIIFLLVTLFLWVGFAGAQQKSYVIATKPKLDSATLAAKANMSELVSMPQKREDVEKLIYILGKKSYEEYAGMHPQFAPEYSLDSLKDKNKFKTLHLFRKGVESKYNVIFIHGGAYFISFSPIHAYFCQDIVDMMESDVYMPLYPLVPNYTVDDTFEMLLTLYKKLLKKGKPILIMGDSSGGNITLSFTLYLKSLGLKLPEAIFPISPMVDMHLDNPEIPMLAQHDPMLSLPLVESTRLWMPKGMDMKDWRVSPIFGEMEGMPKTLFFVATDDILQPDASLCYEKMKRAGVLVRMIIGEKLWHVAVEFPIEAKYIFFKEASLLLNGM